MRSALVHFGAISAALTLLALSGCASGPAAKRGDASDSQVYGSASAAERGTETERDFSARSSFPKGQSVVQPNEIIIKGIRLEHTEYDIPITVNSAVEKWIDYFTGKGRKHMVKYLERSEQFIPYIRPLLRQYGLPEDLVYLAMIESGFNNHARSFARAVGPWQFMPATGKRYGLAVNWWVDERRDTRKSSLSAAQYLKDLYEMFHSWELAAASYNSGEAKIARAIRRYGTSDFWALTRHRFLRPETRDYVPKIIAAALISKNRTQFGFPASKLNPGKDEAIAPDGEVVKLETESQQAPGAAQKEALESVLKGEFKGEDYESASSEQIALDDDKDDDKIDEDVTDAGLSPASPSEAAEVKEPAHGKDGYALAKPVPTPHVSKKGELMGEELLDFEVQSPADLMKISRAAGLSYHTVKSLNPELLRWCTPPSVATYRIKLPVSAKEKFLSNYNDPKFQKRVEFLTFKVRKGQSLRSIAQHFGLKVDPIADLNRLSARSMLAKGALIRLPMPADGGRSVSSLEIRDPPEKRHRRHHYKRRVARRDSKRVSMRERLMNRRRASY